MDLAPTMRPGDRRRTRVNLKLTLGLLIMGAVVFSCLGAPLITSQSPTTLGADILGGPGGAHLLGTDQYGRDMLARVLYAGRVDLLIGVVLVGVAMILGTVAGLVAGWYGGWIAALIMRIVDVGFAFPFLVLVIALVGLKGPGLGSLLLGVSLVAWIFYARLVRAEVLAIRDANYIRAATLSGFSTPRVLGLHVLPNVLGQVLVYGSSDFVYAILLGASVSYLGLGVQSPTPEWGAMVQQGQNFVASQWWLSLFPGVAIIVVGLGCSLIGDGLADVLRTGRR
ncbi:MAG TPA: ABC transporter permease [Solirubrobacteraceae bacterium]|nr:ABC transporter permease [Solirubrobacteraceae bacterium]